MGKPDYRMTVEFTARDGSAHNTTVTTNRPESLEDDAQESVLYDPENREIALPIDGLPGSLSLDESGRIIPGGSRSFLTLPTLSLLCNAWFIWRQAGL
jgi:hypothetical protein